MLKTHQAAVDSELTLIVGTQTKRDGFVPNPKFAGQRNQVWAKCEVIWVYVWEGYWTHVRSKEEEAAG